MSEPIVDFTKEVGRCSYHALESNQELENFIYNGITYAEGVETYRLKLQNLFNDFKGAINSVALQSGSDRVLKSILEDLEKINGQYWDIPTQDVIEGYEKEMATGKYPNHKKTIREMKFLQEMVGAQKSYVQQAIDYIRGLLPEETLNTIKEVVKKEVNIEEKKEKTKFQKILDKYDGNELTSKDVEDIFGVGERTIRNWERDGYLINIAPKSVEKDKLGRRKKGKNKKYNKEDVLKCKFLQEKINKTA